MGDRVSSLRQRMWGEVKLRKRSVRLPLGWEWKLSNTGVGGEMLAASELKSVEGELDVLEASDFKCSRKVPPNVVDACGWIQASHGPSLSCWWMCG
jgi:hypothetical protein